MPCSLAMFPVDQQNNKCLKKQENPSDLKLLRDGIHTTQLTV